MYARHESFDVFPNSTWQATITPIKGEVTPGFGVVEKGTVQPNFGHKFNGAPKLAEYQFKGMIPCQGMI